MSQIYRDLAAGLPQRSPPGSGSFPADPRKAAAWVAALPRANQVATTERLEHALTDLRRSRLTGGQRFGVMEVLRPLLLDTIGSLHRQCQGIPIPLPQAKERSYTQLQKLESELALAYQMAIVELCAPAGSVPFLRSGNAALCLERATYHSARVLEHAYFIYRQPAPGAWLRLHQLFAFARSLKLQDKRVDEPHAGRPLSVGQIYGQAVLTALSNPYRFAQRDQLELSRHGPDLGGLLQLREVRASDDDLGLPLDADRGPGYLASEREEDAGARLWVDLSRLRGEVEQALAGWREGEVRIQSIDGKPIALPGELIARLRGGWGRSTARQTERLSATHQLDSAIGMSGLHFHLAGLVDFETFLRQAGETEDDDDKAGPQRAVWAHAAVDAGRIPLQHAVVIDQSLGGYQLRWPAEEGVKARVDELIGLSVPADGDERQWLLGVIRWLRYDAEGAVDAGVQLLSRRIRPVGLRLLDGGEAPKSVLRGIEYQPVNLEDAERLHFSAAGAVESAIERIEVFRVADLSDLDEPVSLRELADAPSIAENAGDYLLISARRAGSSA